MGKKQKLSQKIKFPPRQVFSMLDTLKAVKISREKLKVRKIFLDFARKHDYMKFLRKLAR